MAARTSTANRKRYKDNLCVALLPYHLEFQVILTSWCIVEYEFVFVKIGKIPTTCGVWR